MPFGLEDNYVVLDGNEFATQKNTNTEKHYFESRVEVKGILNFGFVDKGEEKVIDLGDSEVTSPIIIDSIVALTDSGTADEVEFNLYTAANDQRILIGKQRFSNNQMPVEFPDGIIFPDMALGVVPKRSGAQIMVYVKPVKVLFMAYPALDLSRQ